MAMLSNNSSVFFQYDASIFMAQVGL